MEVDRTLADPVELMLTDLKDKYAQSPTSEAYTRLYADDKEYGHVFANLHERLNTHFETINDRARQGSLYYWAENSRDLISLLFEVDETLESLRKSGVAVVIRGGYPNAIARCRPWLAQYRGSTIPEDFEPTEIVKYEPVFTRPETEVKLLKSTTSAPLQLVGEGAHAHVFSFVDPDYNKRFALKRAKKNLDDREMQRFRAEFDMMKQLSYPHIVEVYQYDETRNEYKMEFCDVTLRKYIKRRNVTMSFATRKRIALQFLYGINHIHRKGFLHRDLSLQNVLLKVYDEAVSVKLSDFGLAKDQASEFTRTHTEMRGTIRDPQLVSFKAYEVRNEVYAIGWVLAYIFNGKESLPHGEDGVSRIIQKCTASDLAQRYQDVPSIIADVDRLEAVKPGASA
jgi:tRNA A-37 threonylcarbamoyl transferase component Bud32